MNKFIVGLVLALICGTAYANYECTGPVRGLTITPTGEVVAESIAGPITWPVLCSIETTENNVPLDTCKAIYATLLAAQLSGQPVTLWFNDNLTCSTHPTWALLTGWYYGPAVATY